MFLYLVRHGDALPDISDDDRRLSGTGTHDVKVIGQFLKKQKAQVPVIYHSTKTRARQTAEILAEYVQVKKNLQEREGLHPSDPVTDAADLADQSKTDLMIVGHMPFLGDLVSLLITGETGSNIVSFPTAGVVILEKTPKVNWVVNEALSPHLLH